MTQSDFLFRRIALIGIGMIGASLALALREFGVAEKIVAADTNLDHVTKALALKLVDEAVTDAAAAVKGADLVILCTPVSSFANIAAMIAPHLETGCIVTDVGSVKQSVVRDVGPSMPAHVHFIPGHPIAGGEKSGPEAGNGHLFRGRWCILTPAPGTDEAALGRLRTLWERCGAQVSAMEVEHHDRVLAMTSHLPHLIAYTIVGTADDLGEDIKQEVIRYSAGGFHDFTRIAASDPVMWRDIFLNNREAVLEAVQRFTEDLTALQRAIRWGEGETLMNLFTRSRAIRRSIVHARQAEPLTEEKK